MEFSEDIYLLQAKVTQQQSFVREMKKAGNSSAQQILDEVNKLTDLRAKLAELTKVESAAIPPFNRKAFDELILRKMYVVQSFEIHNGTLAVFHYILINNYMMCDHRTSGILRLWSSGMRFEGEYLGAMASSLRLGGKHA